MGASPSVNTNFILLQSVKHNDLEIATKALKAGAEVNTVDSQGQSPLAIALQHGFHDLFRLLFQSGGRVLPISQQTPLHTAVELGHYQLASMLVKEYQTFPNYKNSRNSWGQTPVHLAAAVGNAQMVALLMKYNAQTEIKDHEGKTPKDLAMESNKPGSDQIIEQFSVEELLVRKPQPGRAAVTEPDFSGASSLVSKVSSKSTHGSTTVQLENYDLLEVALKDSKLPVIRSDQIQYESLLSRGSSCLVFKGRWRGTNIAIKQFKHEYSQSQKELEKFVKEMQILSQVRHPNLLLLMGISIDQPNLCLISELVPNCTLFQALYKNKEKVLTLAQRYQIALQITQGVSYLHSNRPPIIHRDLKPENCLLDHSLNVKIADFGLARTLSSIREEDNLSSLCIGTTRFMAPELFERDLDGSVGVGIDLWALGCTFIDLFSNKRPWSYISSNNTNCIYYEIFQKKPVPIPENVPESIKHIIRECCQYDYRLRPPANSILEMLVRASC